jgi:hypothetical protein
MHSRLTINVIISHFSEHCKYVNYHNFFRAVFEPRAGETALPVHVVDPIETVGLQPTSDATENKKVSSVHVF